jgi:hypothetical protein
VAKFALYKERECVRRAALSTLVREPFAMYPHFKQAKRQGLKAVMIVDKLYVNGKKIVPVEIRNPKRTATIAK